MVWECLNPSIVLYFNMLMVICIVHLPVLFKKVYNLLVPLACSID